MYISGYDCTFSVRCEKWNYWFLYSLLVSSSTSLALTLSLRLFYRLIGAVRFCLFQWTFHCEWRPHLHEIKKTQYKYRNTSPQYVRIIHIIKCRWSVFGVAEVLIVLFVLFHTIYFIYIYAIYIVYCRKTRIKQQPTETEKNKIVFFENTEEYRSKYKHQ